jgi:hypothetical protein
VKKPSSYTSATAFRQALEARLTKLAREEATDMQRLRRQVAFDRLLWRVFHASASPWALKGGYAMELRLQTTRTTKDIDLSWRGDVKAANKKDVAATLREKLQEVASADLNDHFAFLIGEPIRHLDAAPYGGGRFPVEARMAGRVFARFHIDVGVGDAVLDPLEDILARDWLGFAGIPPRTFPSIGREQQFAEKLHAYTLPRKGDRKYKSAGLGGHGPAGQDEAGRRPNRRSRFSHIQEARNPRSAPEPDPSTRGLANALQYLGQ